GGGGRGPRRAYWVRAAGRPNLPLRPIDRGPSRHGRKPPAAATPGQQARKPSMAKDAIVSQELADKFKTEKDSPYLRFVRGEGLDIISAQYVPNLRTVELKPWARKSGKGVFINHEASRTS